MGCDGFGIIGVAYEGSRDARRSDIVEIDGHSGPLFGATYMVALIVMSDTTGVDMTSIVEWSQATPRDA